MLTNVKNNDILRIVLNKEMNTVKYRNSKQRDEIECFIKEHPGHLSADHIFQGLKANGSSISLATVYRNLQILKEMVSIDKLAHPDEGFVYDKNPMMHHHIMCKGCNKVFDILVEEDSQIIQQAEQLNGCKVDTYSIMFWGTCKECLNK